MPGIIVFRRRWGVGSDDLVVPGLCLSLLHIIWLAVTVTTLVVRAPGETQNGTEAAPAEDARMTATNTSKPITWQQDESCHQTLHLLLQLHIVVLALCLVLEVAMVRIALKGTMWNFAPRHSMEYVLYARLLVLITHVIWSSLSIFWLHGHYVTCPVAGTAKQVLLGAVICNACVALSVIVTVWCTFDRAGRSWVKMKRFQRSMRDGETKFHYRRSGNHRPNWRQRKVMRTYQDTWNHRCKFLFCCMSRSDQYQDSFSEIARLLTDFFRDLDLVPTDIVAGLVLLRKQQKELQETKVNQQVDGIYEFLSGVPVTPKTRFVSLSDPDQLEAFRLIAHYMKFALAAYGWPMYLLGHSTTGLCLLCSQTRCCCTRVSAEEAEFPFVVGDTCSGCHSAALRQACGTGDFEVLYATFHVDVAETPFFVALDYDHQSVIVSIRGTISMKDVITDLHAEAEPIPFQVPIDDWIGHKGMVQCATYIRNKLRSENLLERAFAHRPEKGTSDFQLVLVGHSLGAGTAAILALLLRSEYPDVHCYAYSPPGGLLSLPAAESTKEFVTSVVVGKDVVPRLGLHQLETLRSSLITAIKKSTEPKWQILASSMLCCGHSKPRASELESTSDDGPKTEMPSTSFATHPSDPNITLSMHQPLYPPGRIIHIVRQHLKTDRRESRGESSGERCSSTRSDVDPIYQAVWADTCDFKEVLISPVMVQDHMPDNVLRALNKVLMHDLQIAEYHIGSSTGTRPT